MAEETNGGPERAASPADGGARVSYRAPPFRRPLRKRILHRIFPIAEHFPDSRRGALRGDLLAGLTVAALALPSGMAYAELAGLSPAAGLYALLLPTVVYTFLGSSRQLIVGPEGSIAALVATAVVPLAGGDAERYASLAALLALVAGGIFVVARLCKLGWVVDYLSRAVLLGYIHGVAVVLIVSQLGKLFGLDIGARDPLPQLAEFVREIPDLSLMTLAVGVISLVPLLFLRVLVYRLDDRLFFVNAEYVRGRIHEAIDGAPARVQWFVFDAGGLGQIDAIGVATLEELIGSLGKHDISFVVARLKGPLR